MTFHLVHTGAYEESSTGEYLYDRLGRRKGGEGRRRRP